jgi:hypothetical protein
MSRYFDAPVELAGFAALRRRLRCKASHGSVFTDSDEWREGEITVRQVVARWCGECGRPLAEGERR